jgi:hypothetical protein
MSVAEHEAEHATGRSQRYGTIVVVGGGCYGSYYVRQLRRAAHAGVLAWNRVLVVDRSPQCAVVASGAVNRLTASRDGIEVIELEWRPFFRSYLGEASSDPTGSAIDAIVPSPLMPHLMFEWIVERARERWPDRDVSSEMLGRAPDTPWQRATPDGPHYVSFAEWICPINCIEPSTCPHTRELRTWSLPSTARAYVDEDARTGGLLVGPVIFHCTHRAFGVGMFDTREVLAGDEFVRSVAEDAGADVLIGTMSHCHGAFQRLVVGPPRDHGSAHLTH